MTFFLVDFCQLANYNLFIMRDVNTNLGKILKQQRLSLPLTLRELSVMSGVSASHLGRIERGERFPSGSILRRIAKPLGFGEDELFTLAGYLSPTTQSVAEGRQHYGGVELDPYVTRILAQEPVDMQRAVIGILSILKSIAKGMTTSDESVASNAERPKNK
jgi:transcriptional regulator with XRE-family HTH domain